MSRFVALYQLADDPERAARFETDYRETHLPLVAATPGLVRTEVSRVRRTVWGRPRQHLMAVMYFADEEAMATGLASEEWAASGANLSQIGGMDLATMFILDDAETIG